SAGDRAAVERALRAGVVVVIVDATDVPAITDDDLLAALAATSPSTVRVVWGSELPYGRRVVELVSRSERPCTGLRLSEGMEPILDLVLARRAPRP
ncbi:MAG: hypothetical protein M3Y87_22325, partial [Myxococcota bacterium]|nr:hypothetical protein [Myxococcota bacterium]